MTKIENVSNIGSTSKARSARKAGGPGFAELLGGSEIEESSSVSSSQSIDNISSLLSLQEDEASAKQKRAKAKELLENLQDLNLGLLNNSIKPEDLASLETQLNDLGSNRADSLVDEAVRAIQTRAAVELAKLGK